MSRLNMVRVRKTLMINRMQREVASNPALVAIASVGNMSSADKYKLRYSLADVGATLNFTKNTLKLKSMEALGGEIMGLAPLLRGKTILACGPAEAPMAKQLLSLEKSIPDFFVLGALLNQQRILQVSTRARAHRDASARKYHHCPHTRAAAC